MNSKTSCQSKQIRPWFVMFGQQERSLSDAHTDITGDRSVAPLRGVLSSLPRLSGAAR
jgi:hypothetical protein